MEWDRIKQEFGLVWTCTKRVQWITCNPTIRQGDIWPGVHSLDCIRSMWTDLIFILADPPAAQHKHGCCVTHNMGGARCHKCFVCCFNILGLLGDRSNVLVPLLQQRNQHDPPVVNHVRNVGQIMAYLYKKPGEKYWFYFRNQSTDWSLLPSEWWVWQQCSVICICK